MNEELLKLVTLQKYDKEIIDIQKHLNGSSKKIDADRSRLAKANEQLGDKINELKIKKLDSDKIDSVIASLEDDCKAFNYQLMAIKDEKAYDAMKSQIEMVKSEISQKESAGIDNLEAIEKLSATIELYQEKIAAEDERINGVQDKTSKEAEEYGSEVAEKKAKRDNYAKMVDPKILAKYEKLLGLPGSRAIAELDGRSCMGCYSNVTLEDLERVKAQMGVVNCNVCERILYLPSALGESDD